MKIVILIGIALTAPALLAAEADGIGSYRKHSLEHQFFSESATFGDLNRDGQLDAISGPYWWEGPQFKVRHEFYPALPFDPLHYSRDFLSFVHDFNADGWNDVLVLGIPGADASWYENPGERRQLWRRHVVYMPVDGESPTFGHLFGEQQPPVLICMSRGFLGYATWDARDPSQPWTFHPISPQVGWHRFTHGLGWGDINGDGRHDVLEKDGWWEQPASLSGNPVWKRHAFPFAGTGPTAVGGAQMYAYDIDGDGLTDVVTVKNAHGFGLSWFKQTRAADGGIEFIEHPITSSQEEIALGGVQFSQLHALELADLDGDGLTDLLTGKRWWAHGPKGDPQPNAQPVLYAFLLRRAADGQVSFLPRLLDDSMGVGTQLVARDANGDGVADIIVGNKRGVALLLSE